MAVFGSEASECHVATCTCQRAVSGVGYDDVDRIRAEVDAERDTRPLQTPVTMAELRNATTIGDVPKNAAIANESPPTTIKADVVPKIAVDGQ